MTENELSRLVVGCAMRVHSALGPGLLESAYEACLQFELIQSGLKVEAQKPLPLVYESVKLECGYRVDLLVEGKLIIEVKPVESLAEIHFAGLNLFETIEFEAGPSIELQCCSYEGWNQKDCQ
jgi:GxxExxY protein